jgi:hypothetical protein
MVALFVSILLLFISGCLGMLSQSRVSVAYSDQIQNLPGGTDRIWPEKSLKKAFTEYWNLRYSDSWKNAYQKEAPYFQAIVTRAKYENIVKTTHLNRIDKVVVRSMQKVTDHYYEIQITLNLITSNNEKKDVMFTDRWVYAGDKWYHVMRDMLLFPKAS